MKCRLISDGGDDSDGLSHGNVLAHLLEELSAKCARSTDDDQHCGMTRIGKLQ